MREDRGVGEDRTVLTVLYGRDKTHCHPPPSTTALHYPCPCPCPCTSHLAHAAQRQGNVGVVCEACTGQQPTGCCAASEHQTGPNAAVAASCCSCCCGCCTLLLLLLLVVVLRGGSQVLQPHGLQLRMIRVFEGWVLVCVCVCACVTICTVVCMRT